jgi:peptidoglycan-associated lipoprotein
MNIASKKLCLVIASAALVFAGCSKKPKRPDPSATVMGQTPGGAGVNPSDVGVTADAASTLSQRDADFDQFGQKRGVLEPVYFDFDKSNVKASERPKLTATKDYLDKNPDVRILFEGHCDWRGTAEYNLGLGDRRANAAKKYLVSLGVPAEKIEVLSKGSLDAAKNADDSIAAKDRRAEIVVLKK